MIDRVDGLALVELEDPVAVGAPRPPARTGSRSRSRRSPRRPRMALTVPTGIASARASSAGTGDEAQAEPDRRRPGAISEGEDEEGALRAEERDQQQRRELIVPTSEPGGRDRVEAAGDAARVLDVGDRQPQRVGRGGAEQHHRDRDQRRGRRRASRRRRRPRSRRARRPRCRRTAGRRTGRSPAAPPRPEPSCTGRAWSGCLSASRPPNQ